MQDEYSHTATQLLRLRMPASELHRDTAAGGSGTAFEPQATAAPPLTPAAQDEPIVRMEVLLEVR